MTFALFDNLADWAYIVADLGESVEVTSTRKQGDQRFTTTNAVRRQISRPEKSPSGGVYLGYEVNWLLGAADLPSGKPKPKDTIKDAQGIEWTVIRVDDAAHSTSQTNGNIRPMFWRCGCVNLVLAYDLRDTISIELATIGQDDTYARTSSPWATLSGYDHIPGRCQPIASEDYGVLDIDGHKIMYEVFVGKLSFGDDIADIQLKPGRVVWHKALNDDRYLDINTVRNLGLLDQLPVIDAEIDP